jgi:uncharacterized protein (TIGR00369 family)
VQMAYFATSDNAPGLEPEVAERVKASIAKQTLLSTLEVSIERLAPGHVELGMVSKREFAQQHGFVHAGVITSIADSACGYAAYTLFPDDRDVLTVGFSMNLVAPASQPALLAIGTTIRTGRTITTCRGEVFGIDLDGRRTLVALIQATLMAVTRMSTR